MSTPTTPIGYVAAYVYNMIIVYFLAHGSVAIDTLFLWLVTSILVQFRILQRRFEKAVQESSSDTALRRQLIRNIRFHNRILDVTKKLDGIFGEIIFVMSLVSCSQICFLAFRLVNGRGANIAELIYFLSFLIAVTIQLTMYCYGGQLIKEEVNIRGRGGEKERRNHF